jgi:Holliday junction resolvasome RuvABC endonuclease subunit
MSIKRIMGLDISSKTIGWGILDVNIETKEIKYIDSNIFHPIEKEDDNLIKRLYDTRETIYDLMEKYSPDEIVIEDILLYIANRSTAVTVVCLAVFNRCIGLAAMDWLGKPPIYLLVSEIRSAIKLGKTNPAKEEIPAVVASHLNIEFPYFTISRGINRGQPHITSFDRADAIAAALAYAFILTGKVQLKEKTKKAKSKKNKEKVNE